MKDLKYILLLLALFFAHNIVTICLFKQSVVPKMHDERIRIVSAMRYESLLFDKKVNPGTKIKSLLTLDLWSQGHPHLFETVGAVFWRFVNSTLKNSRQDPLKLLAMINIWVVLTNSLFLLILLLSVYGIGRIYFSRLSGFIAALLVLLLPLVFGHTRMAMLDFPLLCMVSLSMYLLLKTRNFESSFFAILCGISFGLSELVKEAAVLFIAGPALYCIVFSLITGNNKKKVFLNFFLSLICFTAVAGSVFLSPVNRWVFDIYLIKVTLISNNIRTWFYATAWFVKSIGWIVLAVLLPLVIHYIFHIRRRNFFLLIWFLVPLFLFSASSNRSERFLLPILPALALIAVGELHFISVHRWIKNAYIGIIITFAIMQYAFIHLGFLSLVGTSGKSFYSIERGMLTAFRDRYQPAAVKIFDIFRGESVGRTQAATVLFLFNIGEIQGNLATYLDSFRLPFNIACYMQDDEPKAQQYTLDENQWREVVLSAEYIVDKEGYRGEYANSKAPDIQGLLEKNFKQYKDRFYLLNRVYAPDDTAISIYKIKRQ